MYRASGSWTIEHNGDTRMMIAQIYLLFVLGIALSVVVPLAARWVSEARNSISKGTSSILWSYAQPVLKVAVGSAILGVILLLVFMAGGADLSQTTWYHAMLYGYGWDATLQKIREG